LKNLLILFLLFPSKICGDNIIHEKIHESPYNLPCLIEAFLKTSEEDIHRFSLLYRSKGSLEYLEAPMRLMGHLKYMAEIPGNFMVRDQMEYYLLLELSDKKKITFPKKDAILNPIIIKIDLAREKTIPITSSEINNFDILGLSPDIMIISPLPGESVTTRDLFIALSYFGEKDVDPTKVRVYLDGLDVSNRADIDSTYLSLASEFITPGLHSVTVNITNNLDQKYDDISWSFKVLPNNVTSDKLIREQTGRMWANYTHGNVDNSLINIGESSILYEIGMDWLRCIIQYTKSSLDHKYDQPRDRYVIALNNKLINIKLGDSYPSIDRYALNGHHVRGVNFNFNWSSFSVDIIKGNTAQAIHGDPSNGAIIARIDSTSYPTNWIISLSRNNYTFQQELLAAKISFQLGEKFYWDVNYIKVEDNIATVSREIPGADIMLTTSDSIYPFLYDSLHLMNIDLINTYPIIFEGASIQDLPDINWMGTKPKDNLIFGSNIKFGFDESRIKMSSGFSISFLNRNKWNNIQSVSALDTFAFDTISNWDFLESIQLDNTINLSQYENYFNFGMNQQPLIPFILQKDGTGIINILNMSNLNRYSKLQFRYLGQKVELGSSRNGPDYYSLLNPYLRTNFTENYFSDQLNLFQNKLLLYYKRSKIIEGLYSEQTSPVEIRKSLFNISLYPGPGSPIFNIGFISSNRNNGVETIKTIQDTVKVINNDTLIDSIYSDTIDTRINLFNKQLNISMTNHFKFWIPQILSVNILLYDQEDSWTQDTSNPIGYMSKDAASESYGISLKSIYNNYLESTVYLDMSYYVSGQKGFSHYQKRNVCNVQLNIAYHPKRYITKLKYGLRFSNYRRNQGHSKMTQYSLKIGAEAEPLDSFKFSLNLDYRIKYLDTNYLNSNNIFIRAQLQYDIL